MHPGLLDFKAPLERGRLSGFRKFKKWSDEDV
jgi:hypothetical protein